ncbi:hypothetical protein TNCV_3489211 [Trichonephila clavipes]|nr:hypothetical protein TNCV_3489211 [Trichonephila clavipes]
MQKTGFQMLNDDEIMTSVQEESDSVDDEMDEDKDNNEGLGNKKLSLQKAVCLLQNLPSEISDILTDDVSDEEVPANNLLEFLLDS